MKFLSQVLAAIAVIGVLTGFTGGGTYAAFNAQTINPGNVFANGTMTMTNVAGTAVAGTNCSTSTSSGTCATIFNSGSTALKPGSADSTNTVTITYTGSIDTTAFGLYVANYSAKGGSSAASCTAANPASKINLQVQQGATIIYPTSGTGYGTLDGLATTYTSNGAMLNLKGGTNGSGAVNVWSNTNSSVFTVKVNLDASADNTYQGCQSLADLVWYAS